MQKWEYKTMKVQTKGFTGGILEIESFDEQLNRLGQEGWELVSTFVTTAGSGASREAVAIFKRPKALL